MSDYKLDSTKEIQLQFNETGLLPAIVQDASTGNILMLAYINQEAFSLTISTGFATFWSRSRKMLWKKGETSGNMMQITEILVDCDQDCVLYKVKKTSGGACHTKNPNGDFRESCFYRKIDVQNSKLSFLEE